VNILILSNQDIASNFALNLLLPKLAKNHTLSLWLSRSVGKSDNKPAALQQLTFFEQRLFNQFLSPLLNQSAAPSKSFSSFQQLNQYLCTPVLNVDNINSSASLTALQALNADLIISIRFGGILKPPVINASKQGILNLHSGILPDYRGVMATFWSMLQQSPVIGTSLHFIEDGTIDTGRLIKISKHDVDYQASYLTNVLNLYPQGVHDILNTVEHIAHSHELKSSLQEGQGQYFTFPCDEQLAEFESKGLRLFDEAELLAFFEEYYF
jgi:methionyl-tRNA formyltransferase